MKLVSKETYGTLPVFSTNVENNHNYISDNGIINHNCVVDAGYRGEIHLHLFNDGLNDVTLKPGMKIMQFCVVQVPEVNLEEITTDDFDKYTSSRGANGFGSSGMF